MIKIEKFKIQSVFCKIFKIKSFKMYTKVYMQGVQEPFKTIQIDLDGLNLDYLVPSE